MIPRRPGAAQSEEGRDDDRLVAASGYPRRRRHRSDRWRHRRGPAKELLDEQLLRPDEVFEVLVGRHPNKRLRRLGHDCARLLSPTRHSPAAVNKDKSSEGSEREEESKVTRRTLG
jgi:hypothetical protein